MSSTRPLRPFVVRCAVTAAAVALAAPPAFRWWQASPPQVAARYVTATAGDLEALDDTTGHPGVHHGVEGALRAVYGTPRRGPVVVTDVGPVTEEFAGLAHVVVTGTADGVPFTTGVSLQTRPFVTRVLGEYDPRS